MGNTEVEIRLKKKKRGYTGRECEAQPRKAEQAGRGEYTDIKGTSKTVEEDQGTELKRRRGEELEF